MPAGTIFIAIVVEAFGLWCNVTAFSRVYSREWCKFIGLLYTYAHVQHDFRHTHCPSSSLVSLTDQKSSSYIWCQNNFLESKLNNWFLLQKEDPSVFSNQTQLLSENNEFISRWYIIDVHLWMIAQQSIREYRNNFR